MVANDSAAGLAAVFSASDEISYLTDQAVGRGKGLHECVKNGT
jgi:hypothetical protein